MEEQRALADEGLTPGIDFCLHALEARDRCEVVQPAHLAGCAVCLRRWRVTEAELQPWPPMAHGHATAIMLEMAAAFGSVERGDAYRPFYAHVARCPECERRLARLTFDHPLPARERAALRT
jgi:hypothetical protein